jgi:hypothetical protein
MANTRFQYLDQSFTITSFAWDGTGLVCTLNGHKLINGVVARAINTSSSYDSVTGTVQVINVNSFRIVSAPVLGSFNEVRVNCWLPTQTGVTKTYSLKKGEGSETVVQAYVIGTGGAVFDVQFSLDGVGWTTASTVTLTTVNLNAGGFTFTAGWGYIRLNITSIGTNTQLIVVIGD